MKVYTIRSKYGEEIVFKKIGIHEFQTTINGRHETVSFNYNVKEVHELIEFLKKEIE